MNDAGKCVRCYFLLLALIAFAVGGCQDKSGGYPGPEVTPVSSYPGVGAVPLGAVSPASGAADAVQNEPATASPLPAATPAYDVDVYGQIDELDLAGAEVEFLHMHYDWRGDMLQQIIDDFNATNPYGIHVTGIVPGSYPEVHQAMLEGLEHGELPGLVSAYQHWVTEYLEEDGLVSLEPYINHPVVGFSAAELADFYPAFLESDRLPQYGNERYGFPFRRSQGVLYYNADWLARLYAEGALSFAGPPVTPEQFAEAACVAAAEAPGNTGYEIATEASRIAAWTFAFGGDVYNASTGQFTWNNPATVAAMEMMQRLYADGCIKKISEHQGELHDFSAQKALFVYGSSAYMPIYQEAVVSDPAGRFAWSVTAIPHRTLEPVQNSFGPSLSIPRTDPQTQLAAWMFLKHLTQPDVQARWVTGSDFYPVRQSVFPLLHEYVAAHPAYADGYALLPYSVFEPPLAGYGAVHDLAAEAYFRILAGDNVTSVLAELDTVSNAVLAEHAP